MSSKSGKGPHQNVGPEEWVDVRHDQVVAIGTYVDKAGVLRAEADDSCVTWHWGPKHCSRKGIRPDEIVYDSETSAPWCPECFPVRQAYYATKAALAAFEEKFGTDPE